MVTPRKMQSLRPSLKIRLAPGHDSLRRRVAQMQGPFVVFKAGSPPARSGICKLGRELPLTLTDVISRAEPVVSSLQLQLEEITANTRALVPPERLAPIESFIQELRSSGVEDRALPVGALAPAFTLRGALGKPAALTDLLALGPVVLKFFRGRWDAYDMTELEMWEGLLPALRQRKALFLAISPQTPRQNAFTADRHHLTFPILSDPASFVADQFGLAYTVPDTMRAYFRSILVNLPFLHGDETWRLPLPATYALNPSGGVIFAQAFADHRRRPEPAVVLAALDDASR